MLEFKCGKKKVHWQHFYFWWWFVFISTKFTISRSIWNEIFGALKGVHIDKLCAWLLGVESLHHFKESCVKHGNCLVYLLVTSCVLVCAVIQPCQLVWYAPDLPQPNYCNLSHTQIIQFLKIIICCVTNQYLIMCNRPQDDWPLSS